MKHLLTLLLAALLSAAPTLHAATGSAETGDVTVDTRLAGPRLTVGPTLARATGKSANLVSRRARPVRGFARVANAGNFAEEIALRGPRGNRFFRVFYHAPSGNVTGPMISGAHRTRSLAPAGAPDWVRALVRPNRRLLSQRTPQGRTVIRRRNLNLPLRAVSTTLPAAADSARLRVRTR
jgi:hypothetical protein